MAVCLQEQCLQHDPPYYEVLLYLYTNYRFYSLFYHPSIAPSESSKSKQLRGTNRQKETVVKMGGTESNDKEQRHTKV